MKKLPIDLGRKHTGQSGAPFPVKMSEPNEYFPSVHLEWESDYGLPDEGTITFRYRATRSTEEKFKETYSTDLDLLEIVDATPKKKSSKDEYSGDILDKLKEELEGD